MLHLLLPVLLFFGTPDSESYVKYTKVIIQMKDENDKLVEVYSSVYPSGISDCAKLLKGKPAPTSPCDYDGKLSFYHSERLVLEADFNISSCNRIVYKKKGNIINTLLSDKSLSFLKNLRKN